MLLKSNKNTLSLLTAITSLLALPSYGDELNTNLPAMNVVDKAELEETDPYNSDYRRKSATTATKTDTPLMQTPMSVQIIPQQILKDQQVIRLEDALKNISGVSREQSYGPIYDSFMLRGFSANASVYRNGLRLAEQSFETANLQQIEVLKGPASILYGRIDPGGMINISTKKPLDSPYYAVEQQFGSYDLYRTTIDATDAITKDKTLLYRLNMAYSDADSFRDFVSKERFFIAPSFTWRPNERFESNVNFEYRHDRFNSDYGIPPLGNRPAPVPISWSSAEKNTQSTLESYTVGLDWSYKFNQNWKLTNRFLFQQANYQWNELWQGGLSKDTSTGRWLVDRSGLLHGPGTSNNYATNLDLTGKFDTFGIKHTALLGFDYYVKERHDYDNNWDPLDAAHAPPMDLFNPVHGLVSIPNNLPKNAFWLDESEWYGIYFQDQMTLWDKVHLLAGGRYDNATRQSAFASTEAGLKPTPNDVSELNPRVGLLYQPMQWLSLYGNYVTSVGVDNGLSADGLPLKPEHAQQYEFGMKNEFFNGQLSTSLAYYHIDKLNIAIPDPNNRFFSRSIGAARSQGIELDINGKVTDKLSLIASYAYTDARITNDHDSAGGLGNTGKRLPNVAEHSGSVWTKYDISKQFSLGTGVYVAGEREGDPANSYQMPGYTRWDAMAAYRFDIGKYRLTTQLNVNNILDQQYYLNSNTGTQILPASPLSFLGSIKLEY